MGVDLQIQVNTTNTTNVSVTNNNPNIIFSPVTPESSNFYTFYTGSSPSYNSIYTIQLSKNDVTKTCYLHTNRYQPY